MKVVFLVNDDEEVSRHEYSNLNDVQSEFLKLGIEIPLNVEGQSDVCLDDHVKISHNVQIGNAVKIGCDTVICSHVIIGNDVKIGEKSCLERGVTVGNNAKIGAYVKLNRDASISDWCDIFNDCVIHANVKIGCSTLLGKGVIIHIFSQISNNCNIFFGTIIGCGVKIGEHSAVGTNTKIGEYVKIGANSNVNSDVRIPDRVVLKEYSDITHSLFITGSRFPLNWYSTNEVRVGCMTLTIEEWQLEYRILGKRYAFTSEQLFEYKNYLDICAKFQARLLKPKA